ncbi:MAG: ABC transporter substrate-binding protein [Spirochaetales bacterium]|nr:ABC transporter substrate-binding protein [Spirochaetales bacterium]
MKHRYNFFLPLLITFLLLLGCKDNKPIRHNSVRIVSLAPSLTNTLCKMGLMAQLVGVTDFCKYNDEFEQRITDGSIRRVSGFNTFNFELISSVEPDYIFALDSVTIEQWQQFESLFENTKTKIIGMKHPTDFGDLQDQIRQIGSILHCEDTAAQLCQSIDDKLSDMLPINKTLTVLPEIYYPPFMTVGTNTFIADIVRKAGGKLAVEDDQLWPTVSLEQLVIIDPDVVITETAHSDTNHNLLVINAYKQNRIFVPSVQDWYMQPLIDSAEIAVELNRYLAGMCD